MSSGHVTERMVGFLSTPATVWWNARGQVSKTARLPLRLPRRLLHENRPSRTRRRLTSWVLGQEVQGSSRDPMGMEEETDPGTVPGVDLRIVRYPHRQLRAPNEPVTVFDDALAKLVRDMFKLMYASRGVGLAAPQVGVNKRLMVFNPKGDSRSWLTEVALVNPRIIERSETTDEALEGCLSFPGISGEVERSIWIKVEAEKPNGRRFRVKYTGWTARIFQHEYDHLDGILFIDRMKPAVREQNRAALETLVSQVPKSERAL
ncbi:peptide deformylase [Cyanidiococcus yangmingshanensis]|uniref:Peptide deformylase n=1 Tax=Cyanidiococcus yangmingshanensis TaxID=2690220 RepID=A0A7J7IEX3_9RHOD|nr:peptide deformylase [Cyanidiococcus yangmingshanensis]